MSLIIGEQTLPVQVTLIVCFVAFFVGFVLFIYGVLSLVSKSELYDRTPFQREFIRQNRQGYGLYLFGKMITAPKHRRSRNIALTSLLVCFSSVAVMIIMIKQYGS